MKATILRFRTKVMKRLRLAFTGKQSRPKRHCKEAKYQGDIASDYLKDRAHTPGWHEETIALGALLSRLPNSLKILDLPFGTGRFMPIYLCKGFQITGLDISSHMLEIARQFNRKDIAPFTEQTGDATALPFDDESFDLVVSYRFLGYILTVERARKALEELARVTNSYLIIQTQFLEEGSEPGNADKFGDQVSWAEQNQLLAALGFEVVEKIDTLSKGHARNAVILAHKVA